MDNPERVSTEVQRLGGADRKQNPLEYQQVVQWQRGTGFRWEGNEVKLERESKARSCAATSARTRKLGICLDGDKL